MAADQGLIDSVANDNTKAVAGQPAVLANLSLQNQIAHQNRLNILAEAALATAITRVNELDAEQIASLITGLSTNQQAAKVAQTTPPVTP